MTRQRTDTIVRSRPIRPGRRTGRGTGPALRPGGSVPAPSLDPSPRILRTGPTGCQVARPAPTALAVPALATTTWRLTDRAVGLVLATVLAIAAAALVVVGLTAMRVTSDSYLPAGQLLQQR